MINNWLNLSHAWVLWVVYAGLWIVSYINKDKIRYQAMSGRLSKDMKILFSASIATSIALMVIFPLACSIWFIVGICVYPAYCMIRMREVNPITAVAKKMANDMIKYV